jgi:dimethylglycine dehydrogenase
MPADFSFQLFPDDLDRLEPYIEDAMARVPLLREAGLSKVINGPIPYTPDGNPLIGPMPGVPDAFEACVFTFGIAQAGGAGKVLAEWVTEGETEWDMWSCDPRRFTGFAAAPDYAVAKAVEVYGHEYAMHFPHHAWPAARDRKLSAVHERVRALGAQFGAANGWERANWYAQGGDDTSEAATQTWRRDGPWHPRVREECLAVRDAAGILDLPGFARLRLRGPGAADWLATEITGRVPKPGRLGLGYFADDRGRIVTEMSMLVDAPDDILLITAAVAEWHDLEWLRNHAPASLEIANETQAWSCQILTGPASRAILAEVGDGDLALPWLSHHSATVAGRPCRLARVSFAGELGWEIHSRIADTPAIFEAVMAAGAAHGLRPFGMFALNSLRLEKGYRAWKGDLSTDYTVLQGGLDRFVDWSKPAFRGKAALERERQQGATKRFVILTVEAGDCDAPYMSTVWRDGKVVGETTSGGWGHRVDRSIALGMLRADLAVPGTVVEVEIYGDRFAARVQPDAPLWDPRNARLRA